MADKNKPLYPITFCITHHSPPIPAEDVPKDHGACSALLIGSYMEQPDGKMDFGFSGLNDKGEELQPLQLFQMWTTFATFLSEELPDGGPKELCESVRQVIKKTKEGVIKEKMKRGGHDKN